MFCLWLLIILEIFFEKKNLLRHSYLTCFLRIYVLQVTSRILGNPVVQIFRDSKQVDWNNYIIKC